MATHYSGTPQEIRALDAFIKLTRAAESVNSQVSGNLRSHELTASQFGVLEAIYHLGPMPTGRLGKKILKSGGNMTVVIDNLDRCGLVERRRSSEDRRRVDIHLTKAGERLVKAILPGHVQEIVAVLSTLTAEEQEQLAGLCRQLGLAAARQP